MKTNPLVSKLYMATLHNLWTNLYPCCNFDQSVSVRRICAEIVFAPKKKTTKDSMFLQRYRNQTRNRFLFRMCCLANWTYCPRTILHNAHAHAHANPYPYWGGALAREISRNCCCCCLTMVMA